MQARPLCVPIPTGTTFVWFEKVGHTYAIWGRRDNGGELTKPAMLHALPEGAKPWELQAQSDESGSLWLTWAQAVKGKNTVEVLRVAPDGSEKQFSVTAASAYNHRPRMVALSEGDIYLIWDAYARGTYDVYGCSIAPSGPSDVAKISRDAVWENKSTICRDRDGSLWAVWVRCQDVMWRDSVIHQRFSLRGARYDGHTWEPLIGSEGEGEGDIASLNYGLLTDFSVHPQLGHMGRRLHPILKSAAAGGVWLFYGAKADQGSFTLESKGRLCAQRCVGGKWSEPSNVIEGNVFYELPHNGTVGEEVYLLSRDIELDELHLQKAALSDALPLVPAECRTVDMSGWKDIALPLPEIRRKEHECNQLPGRDSGRYRLFWGDLHVHSAVSIECEGEPDELAHYARDKALIDVLTLSDNDHFWNKFTRKNQCYMRDYEWDHVLANALVTNEPGRFAMFPGYEMTIGGDHRKERNHLSTMADDDEMEREVFHFKDEVRKALAAGKRRTNKDLVECLAWAKKKGYLPLPHAHVNWWTLVDTDVQCAVDVCSAWERNIERYDIYFDYLNQGCKFGFTGSSDSHYRNPGLGGALTGIWAERLDRRSILEALRARRCYATAGQRIVIEFTINDRMVGSSTIVAEDPVLKWRVVGHDQEYILRIHRDGRLMHEDRFIGRAEGELREFKFIECRQGRHYYYLEVLSPALIPDYPSNVAHALGARAWSSPIWVETVDYASS